MKIDFNLTKDDYMAFNMYYLENSTTVKRSLFIQRYVLSLIFLVAPFVLSMATDIPLVVWFVVYGAVFVLWIIFYPRYFMKSTKKRILKMIDEGKNAHLFGFRSIILTESGVEEMGEQGESKSTWKAIEKVVETEDYIYIFIGTMSAYIIPERAFESEGHKKDFVALLKNKTES